MKDQSKKQANNINLSLKQKVTYIREQNPKIDEKDTIKKIN